MMGGRRPTPTAIRRANGNPGRRAWNHDEPVPPDAQPRCPGHLSAVAQKEWLPHEAQVNHDKTSKARTSSAAC